MLSLSIDMLHLLDTASRIFDIALNKKVYLRFTAQRGRSKIIYIHNGTNLVGSQNILRKINWIQINKYATVQRINWRFYPPNAAWWAVSGNNSLKNLMKKIFRENLFMI